MKAKAEIRRPTKDPPSSPFTETLRKIKIATPTRQHDKKRTTDRSRPFDGTLYS